MRRLGDRREGRFGDWRGLRCTGRRNLVDLDEWRDRVLTGNFNRDIGVINTRRYKKVDADVLCTIPVSIEWHELTVPLCTCTSNRIGRVHVQTVS
jgi:hypothetical protein